MKKVTKANAKVALQLRVPRSMIDHLTREAQANGRSLNSEIAIRLATSLGGEWVGPSAATYRTGGNDE